jgi:hypothetical protein
MGEFGSNVNAGANEPDKTKLLGPPQHSWLPIIP